MNLKSIEYFLITAEEMNFTRAAERLYISQQALSSHIKRLEEEYSVRLFERKPALHLTLEGEQMVFYGKQILDSEKKMLAAFSDISTSCRGALKVGISRLRSNVFFPDMWRYYHPSHPNISIELVDGNSTSLDELLQAGKLDLYLGVNIPASPNRQRIKLAREVMYRCFSQKLLARYYPDSWQTLLADFQREGVDFDRIAGLPFGTVRQGNKLRDELETFFATTESLNWYLSRISRGLSISLPKMGKAPAFCHRSSSINIARKYKSWERNFLSFLCAVICRRAFSVWPIERTTRCRVTVWSLCR